MSEQNNSDDYDSPWKNILESYFEEFMQFFFPDAARDINWSHVYEFWDKELQQVVRDANLGRRYADKLVRVWRNSGEQKLVLVHIEIQGQRDTDLAERMFVYNYRCYDRFKQPVASLAVLADESAEWRPNSFSYGFWGSETSIRFPVVKLTDYRNQIEMLETSDNPFALATLAHLETQQTRKNAFMRFESKLRFTRSLYIRGWSREKIIELFHFIDWIMQLPSELEDKLWVEINKIEEEGKMPYISSVERIGYRRGLDEGEIKGRKEYIGLGLSLKFGDDVSLLMASISEIQDPDRLLTIMNAIFTTCSIEEIQQMVGGKHGTA